jgi:transcription elongation factor GreA-like protein
MNWFTKKVETNTLYTRLQHKEVAAAREVLQKFVANLPSDRDRVLQALTVLVIDFDNRGEG